jgi:type IV fimbrial biogenesis protein FimT
MNIPMNKRSYGFTLIEVMITLAVMALLFMVGMPSMNTWLQNTQLRASAEGIQAGLQLARAESLRRNVPVRFQLVDTLTGACVLKDNAANWIVSLADPTAACGAPEDDTARAADPRRMARRLAERNVAATNGGVAANTVVFSGLGRVIGVLPISRIDISNPSGGACQPAGPMRCLRINIASGGAMRMCDPIVVDPTDPRLCN